MQWNKGNGKILKVTIRSVISGKCISNSSNFLPLTIWCARTQHSASRNQSLGFDWYTCTDSIDSQMQATVGYREAFVHQDYIVDDDDCWLRVYTLVWCWENRRLINNKTQEVTSHYCWQTLSWNYYNTSAWGKKFESRKKSQFKTQIKAWNFAFSKHP